jgi:putative ABC transport system permease protein
VVTDNIAEQIIMILQNLKLTIRNFRNQKLFTFVNLAGLTLGIVSASLILIYVNYELSFDRFHWNSKNIFRVYSTFTMGGVNSAWAQTPTPLAPYLQDRFPEINNTVRITRLPKGLVSAGDKNFFEERIIMSDSGIFKVFTFPLISGNPDNVLSQPNSVVLTESIAKKYFGESDPLGKNIRYNRATDLTVTGIMKDIPDNTHLQFDMLISASAAKKLFGNDFFENRMNTVTFTYLLAKSETDFKRLDEAVSLSTKEYDQGMDMGDNKQYHIQPLTSIHLHSDMGGEYAANSDVKNIYILATIALLILFIACINYINLSLSINNRRSAELGIRKIMGARRGQLIFQYLTDAFVLVGTSIIISAIILSDQVPIFSSLAGVTLTNNYPLMSLIFGLALIFLMITIITGLTSGWISSGISPMETLKKPVIKTKKLIGTQGILVLFQFGISIALIVSTLFVYRQMKFIRNLNLGFSKDQLMIIPLNDNNMRSKIMSFKQELSKNPNILSSGATSGLPGEMVWVASIDYEGQSEPIPPTMTFLEIDNDFVKTYGVQLSIGYLPGDTACPYTGTPFLLNESAARKLGWDNPVGKRFSIYPLKDGFVSGIVKDFHFKSLHEKIEPLFLYIKTDQPNYLAVKLNTSGISGSVEYIENLWNKMVPESPFEYFFYDSYYDQLYKKESQFGKIIFIFSAIAILIACMGLFGLAAFFSEKRTKEIGIRKVNGASIPEMMTMLNREFVKWVLIAFIIATPVAWYAVYKWLQSFAYKTEMNWWIFGFAGVIAMVIAILTVSWQSWRASIKNPVDALRYE